MQTESKTIKETLEPILRVLSDLGGKFTFMDDEGREFVLASREALEEEHMAMHQEEQQLELLDMDKMASAIRKNIDVEIGDDVIDRINRDIALTAMQEQDELDDIVDITMQEDDPTSPRLRGAGIDDIAETVTEDDDLTVYTRPEPPKIRFESDRGDLSPHLQD